MTGAQLHRRVRTTLNDFGEAYKDAHPTFSPEDIERTAAAARDVLLVTLIGQGSLVAVSRVAKKLDAVAASTVDPTYLSTIIGLDAQYRPILADPLPIGVAMDGLQPGVWVRGMTWGGTATKAICYTRPQERITDNDADLTEFGDAFYDTVVTLTAYELLASLPGAADRREALLGLLESQVSTLM